MSYAAPQGKFAKRLKKDKDKWRAEMSAEGEDWRAIVEELEAEIAVLEKLPPEHHADTEHAKGWNDCLRIIRQMRAEG